MSYVIRGVRAEEWRQYKELRLAALQDEVAAIAFLDTYDSAVAKPDSFWRERTEGAAAGVAVKGFVAEDGDGREVGCVTVLVERPGQEVSFASEVQVPQGHLVGVYLRPEARGAGLGEKLFAAALEWSFGLAEPRLERVRLYVHERNVRAEGLYRKCGFVRTGGTLAAAPEVGGVEVEMAVERP
ncbi:GNAT family N-acetyltransferase [Streptomyces sp. NPDC051940]|uniref:GNAT family N-acetyltransferase n=1 Tax=Streptomyces sp. NPDC051940 TaxID=3155675 RepID=UPI003425AE72